MQNEKKPSLKMREEAERIGKTLKAIRKPLMRAMSTKKSFTNLTPEVVEEVALEAIAKAFKKEKDEGFVFEQKDLLSYVFKSAYILLLGIALAEESASGVSLKAVRSYNSEKLKKQKLAIKSTSAPIMDFQEVIAEESSLISLNVNGVEGYMAEKILKVIDKTEVLKLLMSGFKIKEISVKIGSLRLMERKLKDEVRKVSRVSGEDPESLYGVIRSLDWRKAS